MSEETSPVCVWCGYCCTVGVCSHGSWDTEKSRCRYLTEDDLCEIYDEIKDDSRIGFGTGCSSSPGNERRRKKLAEIEKKHIANFSAFINPPARRMEEIEKIVTALLKLVKNNKNLTEDEEQILSAVILHEIIGIH